MHPKDSKAFARYITRWFRHHGRVELPWRQTTNPYHILVSEVMLQQTQVERVIPLYNNFIHTFPTLSTLSTAPLQAVLSCWQGLGYNRRARYLQATAQELIRNFSGVFPQNDKTLQTLPGIGSYTAGALCNFAFNIPTPMIETNIRTVFLHHFFPEENDVPDAAVLKLVGLTLEKSAPREWFWALMDYGSYLKKILPNPNSRSKTYHRQSRFQGSLRQVRGEIIKMLAHKSPQPLDSVAAHIAGNPLHFPEALNQLIKEKLIVRINNQLQIAD